jgi:hypothetical protein
MNQGDGYNNQKMGGEQYCNYIGFKLKKHEHGVNAG